MSGNYGWRYGDDGKEFLDNERELTNESHHSVINEMPTPEIISGYYWRDNGGGVPHDAVKAGMDKDGGPLYVGRAFHEGEMIPGKVVGNQNVAYIPHNGEEHAKSSYEILCKGNASVIWQESSGGGIPHGAVPVGFTSGEERLFVGRVFHDGTLTPGKIHPSHGVCYIPYGGEELSFPNYEVLIIH